MGSMPRLMPGSCCLFLMLWLVAGVGQAETRSFRAKVKQIVDGDTIEILWHKDARRVRIWGIDCPEWDQPYSAKSKEFTREMLVGKVVEVVPKDNDTYGRLVAVIIVNHANISEELVRSGLAWVHIYYCKEPVCERWMIMQKKARAGRLGLWRDHHPIPPWLWKRTHGR